MAITKLYYGALRSVRNLKEFREFFRKFPGTGELQSFADMKTKKSRWEKFERKIELAMRSKA